MQNVLVPALALAAGGGLLGLALWTWALMHPMMALGPLAAGQLAVMIGALDRWLPGADRRVTGALQAIAWAGLWAGAAVWGVFLAAVIVGIDPF